MKMLQHYPAAPANVPPDLVQASDAYRKEVGKVILAIFAFVCTYLVMALLAVGLAWACWKTGIFIIAALSSLIALLMGLGVMLMGGLVLFFLVKFLFASTGNKQAMGIQIKEEEEPALFEFIRRVAAEVGTHFPAKVFLLPDVNASVFYNSGFWSLFFPTKKNLNIGLGLVNVLNVSEFKAVLAHEFGHFSQKSMRVGSYVYYVNQVIFNLLYSNNGWVDAANGIARIHAILGFFVRGAAYIVQGIQWVLRGMYTLVNRQYLRLSREMEFHADAVAASVSGSNNTAQALRQVELGTVTYRETIQACNELLNTKQAPLNAYSGQRAIAVHLAAVHDLPLRSDMPLLTRDFMERQAQQRIQVKDQWASHPTLREREAHLQAIPAETPVVAAPAWAVFENPERWQQVLTDFLYESVDLEVNNIEDEDFVNLIRKEKAARDLPKIYRGYYDGHLMNTGKWPETASGVQAKLLTENEIDQFFVDNLDQKIAALQRDLETLKAIDMGQLDVQFFDFDGKKHDREAAPEVQQLLETALEKTQTVRDQRDADAIAAFYAHALAQNPAQAPALKTAYDALHDIAVLQGAFLQHGQEIFTTIHGLARNHYNVAQELSPRFRELYEQHEPYLRALLNQTPSLELFPPNTQEKIKAVFGDSPLSYHQNHYQPNRDNLEKLQDVIVEVGEYLGKSVFERQKVVLESQAHLVAAREV